MLDGELNTSRNGSNVNSREVRVCVSREDRAGSGGYSHSQRLLLCLLPHSGGDGGLAR